MTKNIFILTFTSYLFFLLCFKLASNDIEKIQIIKDNYYIDSIELVNYKGKTSLIKENEASYYIINFWASWCAPCIKEMKSLNLLQKKAPYLRVITISQDRNLDSAKKFFEKNKYEKLEKYFDKDKKILSSFSIRGLPTTFIANRDFKVFAKIEGIIEWDLRAL